jgi:hypothetical protein
MGETGVGVVGAGSIRSWLIPSALRIVVRLLLPAILLLSILILVKVALWRITTGVLLLLLLLLGLRLQSARRLLARC